MVLMDVFIFKYYFQCFFFDLRIISAITDKADDIRKGLPSYTMAAPSPLELLSTVSTIGLVSSKYASTGAFVHISSLFGNFFPVHFPYATLLP